MIIVAALLILAKSYEALKRRHASAANLGLAINAAAAAINAVGPMP